MTDTVEENIEHECLICLENITGECYELTCCGEKYCMLCLENWRNSADRPTCPKCRSEFEDEIMPPPPSPPESTASSPIPSITRINDNEMQIGDDIVVGQSENDDNTFYIRDVHDSNNSTVLYINESGNFLRETTRTQLIKTFFWKNCSMMFFGAIIFYMLIAS